MDLATGSNADSGADFFINAGHDYLDSIQGTLKSNSRHFVAMVAGDYKIELRDCFAVKQVWLVKTGSRAQLSLLSLTDMRVMYGMAFSEVVQGAPIHYTVNLIGLSPEQFDYDAGDFTGMVGWDDVKLTVQAVPPSIEPPVDEVLYSDNLRYQGIIVMPPPDEAYTAEIIGQFKQPLANDADRSFWTEVHSDILIQAALYKLELFYRNLTGANETLLHLTESLRAIGVSLTIQEMAVDPVLPNRIDL